MRKLTEEEIEELTDMKSKTRQCSCGKDERTLEEQLQIEHEIRNSETLAEMRNRQIKEREAKRNAR